MNWRYKQMKKSSVIAIALGTSSVVLFSLGMCMVLTTEWNVFQLGIIFGFIGLLLGIITLIVWRKMKHKQPINVSGKTILTVIIGIAGTMVLGIGMCFSMVWGKMIIGITIGLAGLITLICLIPLTVGIKD